MTGLAAVMVIGGGGGGVGATGSIGITFNVASVRGSYTGTTPGAFTIATGSVVATPTGGVAPYTYSWTQVSVGSVTWTIGTPAAGTTNFSGVSVPDGTSDTVNFNLKVTDATGAIANRVINAFVNNKDSFLTGSKL